MATHIKILMIPLLMLFSSPAWSGTVTFRAQVPANTPPDATIYVVGDVGQLGSWDPGAVPLQKVGDNLWEIRLFFADGSRLEYKYTRGDWGSVEKDSKGDEIGNRSLAVSGDVVQEDEIARWADIAPVGQPATSNTPASPRVYVGARFIADMVSRSYADDGYRWKLRKPDSDIELDFRVAVNDDIEAYALFDLSTYANNYDLGLDEAYIKGELDAFQFYAYSNQPVITFDDPLQLLGNIGDTHDDFGEDTQGILLTLTGEHRLLRRAIDTEATFLFADDTREVDWTGGRLKLYPYLGFTFLIVKPQQAVPVPDREGYGILPNSWWEQFYPDDVDRRFKYDRRTFSVDFSRNQIVAFDGHLPLAHDRIGFFAEIALGDWASFEGKAQDQDDTTRTLYFKESMENRTILLGVRAIPLAGVTTSLSYEREDRDITTNRGKSYKNPTNFEPRLTLVKGDLSWEGEALLGLAKPLLSLTISREIAELLPGYTYGYPAFFEQRINDREGALDNFPDVYLQNANETFTLEPGFSFEIWDALNAAFIEKWRRYTFQELTVADNRVALGDRFLKSNEFLARATYWLTSKFSLVADWRWQVYWWEGEDCLYRKRSYSDLYSEVGYDLTPQVRFSLGYGVNPVDRHDKYLREWGRINFLRDNRPKDTDLLTSIFQAERLLEDEERLTLQASVRF